MRHFNETFRLIAIAIGMAISITCNTVLASLFAFVDLSAFYGSLAISGAAMAVIVLCFTELSSKFPGAIGIRAFTKSAFGNKFSVASTLFYVCMVVLMGALEVYLCHQLLQQLLPKTVGLVLLCFLLVGVVVVNLNGYEFSMKMQVIMAMLVVCMMIVLSTLGMNADPVFHPERTARIDWMHSIPSALFIFIGIEWAVMHVGRHETYKRILPIALIISVLTVAILYGYLGTALYSHFTATQLAVMQLPHLALAKKTQIDSALFVVTALSLLAMLTNFNVGLSGAARMLYSLAREGEIPIWFSKMRRDNLAPQSAILFITACVLICVPVMSSDALSLNISLLLGVHLCIVYGVVLFSWWQLRRRNDTRGVRQAVSIYVVVPVFFLLAVVVMGILFEGGNNIIRYIFLAEGIIIFALSKLPVQLKIATKEAK